MQQSRAFIQNTLWWGPKCHSLVLLLSPNRNPCHPSSSSSQQESHTLCLGHSWGQPAAVNSPACPVLWPSVISLWRKKKCSDKGPVMGDSQDCPAQDPTGRLVPACSVHSMEPLLAVHGEVSTPSSNCSFHRQNQPCQYGDCKGIIGQSDMPHLYSSCDPSKH